MIRSVAAIVALATLASPALAKDINVKMLNTGPGGAMVFDPPFVKASVGDTVHFLAAPSHNAELIPTMLPAGVPASSGKMNQSFDLKVTVPGVYGVRCKPHYSMGMVALVQVGNGPSSNLASARAAKLPGLAAKRMQVLLARAR